MMAALSAGLMVEQMVDNWAVAMADCSVVKMVVWLVVMWADCSVDYLVV